MLSFRQYLLESFHNYLPHDVERKAKDAVEVHKMIHDAYASQGGNHTKEFATPESMVKHIPMWKLSKKDGKITSAAFYADKDGRKRIAIASDGSAHGKKALGDVVGSDLKQNRAHMEVSGKSLSFLKKQVDVKPHAHTFEQAKLQHEKNGKTITKPDDNDPEVLRHPELKDHFYVRNIGGEDHTKIMLGTKNKTIL